MKKYKVLREMPFAKVGEVVELHIDNFLWLGRVAYGMKEILCLVKEGWLAEILEEKDLWEKLYERTQLLIAEDKKECQEVAKIARQHFAEVARKAVNKYHFDPTQNNYIPLVDFIIQAIESDGEK